MKKVKAGRKVMVSQNDIIPRGLLQILVSPVCKARTPRTKLPDVCTSIQCNYTIVHFKVALRRDASASAERRRYS